MICRGFCNGPSCVWVGREGGGCVWLVAGMGLTFLIQLHSKIITPRKKCSLFLLYKSQSRHHNTERESS